ncbi:MAG: NAD(P)H-dependent oxidoreductase [Rickettsiales bacterium]|nr:NAD(P)H-dependent oxidoreductase [Rickettsiales bacterium]
MKTLIVQYLPTGANSATKKVLDLFLNETKNQEIEVVNLLEEPMPIFDEASIQAYYKRNYGGQKLDALEAQLLEQNDHLAAQLKSADVLVMAYPMHNFGMPAAVKAWLDAVVLKGETFDYGKKMMAGKKVLTIFTSGGIYSENTFNFDYPNWNGLMLTAKANFTFMGFDEAEFVGASLRDEATRGERLADAKKKLQEIVKKWY